MVPQPLFIPHPLIQHPVSVLFSEASPLRDTQQDTAGGISDAEKTTGGIKKKQNENRQERSHFFFFAIIVGKFLISNTDCFPSVFTNSTRQ